MSKKERFGLSPKLSQAFTDIINIEANNEGIYRNAVIPLTRIEPDPNNPRKLSVSVDEIRSGRVNSKNLTGEKLNDFDRLQELAQSIKMSGLINPIVVYKHDEKYRVIAGERRLIASIIANKTEIEARVFNSKPGMFELKLVQWFENTEREDLSILERVDNVRDIIQTYKSKKNVTKITIQELSDITGMSTSLAGYYMSLFDAPTDVIEALKAKKIINLEKAALISKIENEASRAAAIEACTQSISLAELRKIIANFKNIHKAEAGKVANRIKANISLGSANSLKAVKTLINAVIQLPNFENQRMLFESTNWDNKKSVIGAFKKLMKIIETQG